MESLGFAFHTPASYDYKDKSITNEDLILGLAKAGVSVVAITDHHVIDVSRIHELQEIGKTMEFMFCQV